MRSQTNVSKVVSAFVGRAFVDKLIVKSADRNTFMTNFKPGLTQF